MIEPAPGFHGEYKMPGGKLVQVDFNIENGRLCDVEVSGDFFLYPEEALAGIVSALDGSAADLETGVRAGMIAAAIPAGTEWLGSSPDGLALAVERALQVHD